MHKNNDIVILIHGLTRTHRSMSFLRKHLMKCGYHAIYYQYPSTRFSIAEHSIQFKDLLETLLITYPDRTFNFVTHSLGGIIAREALSSLPAKYLSRCKSLVMLAAPNAGSNLARRLTKMFPMVTKWIKPLAELSTDSAAYIHRVPTPSQVNIGNIAGRFDAKAPPESAFLKGQSDYIVTNSAHTFIMNSKRVRRLIINFLRSGKFLASAPI